MRIKFNPMPGLSIVTLICLGILLTLGTWQYKRLQWKTRILAEIDQAAHAKPLHSLADINQLLAQGKPVDFRRVSMSADFIEPNLNGGKPFHLMRSNGKAFTWRLYQPIKVGEHFAYVASREFTETQKDEPPNAVVGKTQLIGYVRLVHEANWAIPKSDTKSNRWFAFNASPENLDWSDDGRVMTDYYIDQLEHIKTVDNLPVRIPEIANNHLDYMLTWYSFALILLVIYFLLHKKLGRLRIEKG